MHPRTLLTLGFVSAALSAAPTARAQSSTNYCTTDLWNDYTPSFDDRRFLRASPSAAVGYMVYTPTNVSAKTTTRLCADGSTRAVDELEEARYACNQANVDRMKQMTDCAYLGIGRSLNPTAIYCNDGSAMGKLGRVRSKDACAVAAGADVSTFTELKPIGNGRFNACYAFGPPPSDTSPAAIARYIAANGTVPSGCCLHETAFPRDAHKQDAMTQLAVPGVCGERQWLEDYLERTVVKNVACNAAGTAPAQRVFHSFCSLSSADIFIEGLNNPPSLVEAETLGFSGTCKLATVDERYTFDVPPGMGNVAEQIKRSGERYGQWKTQAQCSAASADYVRYCPRGGSSSGPGVRVIAHSNGAIAASAWNLPLDAYIGSVGNQDTSAISANFRNNHDPIPQVAGFAIMLAASGQDVIWGPSGRQSVGASCFATLSGVSCMSRADGANPICGASHTLVAGSQLWTGMRPALGAWPGEALDDHSWDSKLSPYVGYRQIVGANFHVSSDGRPGSTMEYPGTIASMGSLRSFVESGGSTGGGSTGGGSTGGGSTGGGSTYTAPPAGTTSSSSGSLTVY